MKLNIQLLKHAFYMMAFEINLKVDFNSKRGLIKFIHYAYA